MGVFVVGVFDKVQGVKFVQVFVFFLVFGQYKLVVVVVFFFFGFGKGFFMLVFYDIKFIVNDRFEVVFFCFCYKFESVKYIVVVCQGNVFLAVFGGFVYYGFDIGGVIEQ